MDEIRSNPSEESLESSEAREEMETLDEATHEAEAHIEKTGRYEEAEVIEDLVKGMVKDSPEKVELTEAPGMSDASLEKTENGGDRDEVTPINLPNIKKMDISATPPVISKDEIGSGTGAVSMEAPDPGPHPPPELVEEESILGTAPTEMPPEMDKSDEMVGLKFYKPIPADEDGAAMVKGEVGEEPEPPSPDPDTSGMVKGEIVGVKFHPGEEVSGSISPGIDQVSKIDSFTREGELYGSAVGEDIPDLKAPPISELSEERGYVKQIDERSKDPTNLEACDGGSKAPANLTDFKLDSSDADSSTPEGDEIEEGD